MTQRMRAAPVLTWAGFPGSTLAPQGLYFFSDVGVNGSFWYNNGASLKPIGPILLYRLMTPFISTNGTAYERYAITPKIPKGVIQPGMGLETNFLLSKDGTVESTANLIKIGTNADGVSDSPTSISQTYTFATTNRQIAEIKKHSIISNTSLMSSTLTVGTAPYSASASAISAAYTVPDLAATDLYISLGGTKTTGGIEVVTTHSFEVILQP